MLSYSDVFSYFIDGWGSGFGFSMISHFVWLATGAGKWFGYLGGSEK